MTNQTRGILYVLVGTLGGGIFTIPYRLSLETVPPLTVVCGVFIWALIFSTPGAWLARNKFRYSWKLAFIALCISLAGVLGNYAVTQALLKSSPTLVALLTRSEIIMAMILSWFFLKEKVTLRLWTAVGLILCGIIVMRLDSLGFELDHWTAILWALLTALSFAIMQIMAKSIINEIDPQILNCARLFVAILILGSFPDIRNRLIELQSTEWLWVALAAFSGPFIGRVCYTYALRDLTIAQATAIASFAPATTLIFQYLVFGTFISWLEALGGTIIILGIFWVFLPGLEFKNLWNKKTQTHNHP